LITIAVIDAEENDDNKILVYVQGHEKREWLTGILDSDDSIIETLVADYEDIDSLYNLDVTNTVRCGKHVKNCYRKYLKFTTGGHNTRKKYIKFKK